MNIQNNKLREDECMSFKKLVLLVGLSMLFVGCSTGRYDNAAYGTKPLTKTQLGVRYLLGRGVKQNDEKAFYYFSQAADEDDAFAQNEVAYLYATGKGTPKNEVKAFEYYQKAAEHGLASAEYNLGLLYLHGIGTQQNKAQALQWIGKSAARGFEPAKIALKQNS